MKTVAEVEPRIAIHAGMLPLMISESGSYYLIGSIETAGEGIHITTNGVTLDLNGYTLSGGTENGISAGPGRGIVIRNGIVTGWSGNGIHLDAHASRVEEVIAEGNLGHGIRVYAATTVSGCVAFGNGGAGIRTAYNNCLVIDCVAADNLEGIDAVYKTTIRGCTANHNSYNGIRVGDECLVRDNHTDNNGWFLLEKAGILAVGARNRIEANHVSLNRVGIQTHVGENVIVRNTLQGNLIRDRIVAGNDVGPWGSAATATSPWANIVVNLP